MSGGTQTSLVVDCQSSRRLPRNGSGLRRILLWDVSIQATAVHLQCMTGAFHTCAPQARRLFSIQRRKQKHPQFHSEERTVIP